MGDRKREITDFIHVDSFIPIALIMVLLLSGCGRNDDNRYQPSFSDAAAPVSSNYIFGVHPLHNPQRLHEVFAPLTQYLSDNIDEASFSLEASRNYAAYDEKLYAKRFHFSLPNPFQTINAIDKGYRVFAKMGDDENFRGIILIRKDSGIEKISDLIGQSISYPAPTALAATMMPQLYLQDHGINVVTELDNRYVGSQESSILNVQLGHTLAGATWPPPWEALRKERPELSQELEIKWQTEPLINNGLVVLPEVPEAITLQVSALLLDLHNHDEGRQILKRMMLSRFEPANDTSYNKVRDFVIEFDAKVRPVR